MASSSFLNLPDYGKPEIHLPQSDPQFRWRNNPIMVPCRALITGRIQEYLAQHASGQSAQETSRLAAVLESELFRDASSKNDYMCQENFFSRLQNVIAQKWMKASSPQQELMCVTTSSPICASDPMHGMLKGNLITNFNKPVHDQVIGANAGCNLAFAPNHSADVPRSSEYGLQKYNLDTHLEYFEQANQYNFSSGVRFLNAESTDSGTTCSGSILQYDSEASFESHCCEPQNSAGEINLVLSGGQSSPSVHTPIIVGENLNSQTPTVSDGVDVQQPMQFGKQLSHPKSPCSERFEDIKSSGFLPVQRRYPYASQDSPSTSSNMQLDYVTKFLCCYISYNNWCREEHQVPFTENLHSLICEDGICICEKYKALLSHYDNCGSADCITCGPALAICSAEGVIRSEIRTERNGCKRSACGDTFSRAFSFEGYMNPKKSRKLNTSERCGLSCDSSGITEEPSSPSGPLTYEQSSVLVAVDSGDKVDFFSSHENDTIRISTDNSHMDDDPGFEAVDATNSSENPSSDFQQKGQLASSQTDDATRMSQAGKDAQDQGSNFDNASKYLDDPSAKFCLKEIGSAVSENMDSVFGNCCDLPSDSVPNLCKDKSFAQNVEFVLQYNPKETQAKISGEGLPLIAGSKTGMESEKQKVAGISLIDFFTHEEIKQHLSSLRPKEDQGLAEETVGNEANYSSSDYLCQLCTLDKQLSFSPLPIYCSSCAERIKNHATYYSTNSDNSDQCFCSMCYKKSRGSQFTVNGLSIPKINLEKKKNDLVTVESWVQCDRCEGWQHQICGLYNAKKDSGGKAEYVCPKCYLKCIELGRHMPLPRSTSSDASILPRTLLSDHLEQRLFRRLKQERENKAKAAGKNSEEVPQPADLVIRVVSSVDKRLKVKQQFLDIFPDKSYPAEFPYRSKVVLLFQRIEGVDLCLFAMYVQEFGSACSQPNQRCVYISYLDSVKYFRPDTKTEKGEALRTFVYHEILVGYLEYCKKRGFATCYIWACPPVKGEDYILYCHPETQKTPKTNKLRRWYHSMLMKAKEEKIVVNYSNLHDQFFVSTGEWNNKVTAARLPYFDGDYWSSAVEDVIKKIEQENLEEKLQKSRRNLRALGQIQSSAGDSKDILLMNKLKRSMLSAKKDFIVVYLQFVCMRCHEVILSGQRWFCGRCKNYQLCGRCHDVAEQSGLGNIHVTSDGHKHALYKEMVTDVPVDTEDNDAIMENCFLENRNTLLSFCQGNHYQFDSLRRAKHSSMMILYHLHNPNGICSLCAKDVHAGPRWNCEKCPEFSVCSTCFVKDGASCPSHPVTNYLPSTITGTESKTAKMEQLLNVLLHASQCRSSINHPCSYPNCVILRKLFSHARACKIRVGGGCRLCKKTWFIMLMHSRRCEDSNCRIPRCMDLKNNTKRLELESNTQQRKQPSAVADICSQSMS